AVDARETRTGQQLLDVTPVQPATIRVLEGAVVHEIEPAITAATPGASLSAPTPLAAPDGARTAEEPEEPAEAVVTAAADTEPGPAPVPGPAPELPEPEAAPELPDPAPAPVEATVPTPATATYPATAP